MKTDVITRESADSLFSELRSRVSDAGYLSRMPSREMGILAAIMAAYAASVIGLLLAPSWPIRGLLLVLLAYLSIQAGLIAHEAAHRNITGVIGIDRLLGVASMCLLVGISYTRFWDLHRKHHRYGGDESLMPQVRDPAVDINDKDVRGRVWSARILFPLMGIVQKVQALQYIWKNPDSTRGDQIALVLHYLLWLVVAPSIIGFPAAFLNYIILAILVGPYAGTLYFITHEGMDIVNTESPPPYLMRQLLSTRDLGSGVINNLLLAGVNHHVGHHLFPGMSRFQLPKARPLIRRFCRANSLPYAETSTGAAFRGLARSLYDGYCVPPGLPGSTAYYERS
ncbi:MAG: fatty acid desaturase [Gammaproteobacteria bacterium]